MHPQGGEQPAEDFLSQNKWVVVREFMDPKESALFDSVLSTRTLNPDKAVFPLHFACADGDLGAIKKMIEKPQSYDKDNKRDKTKASNKTNLDVDQCFMDLPRGSTALQWATVNRYTAIVAYLLSRGANVNQKTRKGQTALHLACSVNHLETIQKLVHAGADPEAQDDSEKTPLDYVLSWVKKGEENDDPIYAFLQSQLSKASLLNKTKVFPVDRALQQMQDAIDPAHSHGQPAMPPALKARSPRTVRLPTLRALEVPGLEENDGENLKALIGALAAHEVAIVVDSREAAEEAPMVFRTTRRTLMRKRNSRLAHAIEMLDMEADTKREREKARGVDMDGRIMTEFRDRDPVLMGCILEYFDEGSKPEGDSTMKLPEEITLLTSLLHEAEFFQLPHLATRCKEALDFFSLRRVDPSLKATGSPGEPEEMHASIADAVAAAREGERIVIAAGIYAESLVFSKSITLLPAPGARVVIAGSLGREATISVKQGSVLLCDLVLTANDPETAVDTTADGQGSSARVRRGSCCTLVMNGGLVLMQRCSIESPQVDYAVFVHEGGRINFKEVTIRGTRGTGISCTGGSVTMEQCKIEKSGGVGLLIASHGFASVRRSSICENADCGVLVQDEASGIWTGNDVMRNKLAGFAVSSTSDECSLRLNNIYANQQAGVLIFDGGRPFVSACKMHGNEVAGIVWQAASAPRLSSCVIYDNHGCGVLVDSKGSGELRQCEIHGNKLAGVAAKNEASPMLVECDIRDGKDAGVLVYAGAAPELIGCTILRNSLAGIAVSAVGAPHCERCTVSLNASGLSIVEGGQGVFSDCTFAENGAVQVEIVDCKGKPPELRDCTIERGVGCGIVIRGAGNCVLRSCTVRSHALMGIVVAGSGASATVEKGVVRSNQTGGIYISEHARSSFVHTCVEENSTVGALVKRGAIPTFTDCTFQNNQGHGAWFAERALGTLDRCTITGNYGAGMLIESKSNPSIKKCVISACRDCGLLSARGGLGNIVGNTFSKNKPVGLTVGADANPVVFQNTLEGNGPYHMLVMEGGMGHLHGNKISGVDVAALVLDGSARCIVKDNEIKLPLVAGTKGLQRQGGSMLRVGRVSSAVLGTISFKRQGENVLSLCFAL